LSFSLLLVQMQ